MKTETHRCVESIWVLTTRRRRAAMLTRWLTLVTVAGGATTAGAQSFTYGPILGRAVTGDKMIVRWGASANAISKLYVRPKGMSAFASVAASVSCGHPPN